MRLASNGTSALEWLIGGFFQHVDRRYGQDLPTPGYDALNAAAGFPLGPNPVGLIDTPFFSDIAYRFKQYAAFGEATYHFTDQWALTGGPALLQVPRKTVCCISTASSRRHTPPAGVPGSINSSGVSPARHPHLQGQ